MKQLVLCLITNDPDLGRAAEEAGIDRIMIDLETRGKADRQRGEGLFLSDHQRRDVEVMRKRLLHAQLMVRINCPYAGTEEEVRFVAEAGADLVMLPMFRTISEATLFLQMSRSRQIQNCLLVETSGAAQAIEHLTLAEGIGELHFGLNDLRLSMRRASIFDFFIDGTLDRLAATAKRTKLSFGCGGLARLSDERLPVRPDLIVAQQARLHVNRALLGRSFRRFFEEDRANWGLLEKEVENLRARYRFWRRASVSQLTEAHELLRREIKSRSAAKEIEGKLANRISRALKSSFALANN